MGILLTGFVLFIGLPVLYCLLRVQPGPLPGVERAGEETCSVVAPREVVVVRPTATSVIVTITPSGPFQIHRSAANSMVVRPTSVAIAAIRPVPSLIWEDRGWVRSGNAYHGQYRITRRATGERMTFAGRIDNGSRSPLVYISSPPAELRKHAKWQCFQLSSGSEYSMHWHNAAPSVDDSILYVERLLDESINGTRK